MKLNRMFGILTILLQKEKVTAALLAEKFEVNRRTIGRDIDALCMAGIPIITQQGAGGGISIEEGYGLYSGNDTSELFSKVINIDLYSYYRELLPQKVEQLKYAAVQRQLVEFDYFYSKGESHRKIEPYFVMYQWSSWYVYGFCLKRQDWRMFKLLRMQNLQTCDEIFAQREIPSNEKIDMDFSLPTNSEDLYVVALFDKSVKYMLVEEFGTECYNETDDGLLFELDFSYIVFEYNSEETNHEFLVNWLWGFGNKVKILRPMRVIDEIKTLAENILKFYE
ncbi:MAG: WYL domain-containing protein [Oscillospiraceae bacterium]|nr:WYL domain-containing protein [Oscillospiraceae bacterium]